MFFGKRGELRRRYKEGQEDQLGALGLVVNAIVLWNTRYMDAVLSKLQADGDAIADADARRLSPLAQVRMHLSACLLRRSAGLGIGDWVTFYNHRRPHSAHGGETPAGVYCARLSASGPGSHPDLPPSALVA